VPSQTPSSAVAAPFMKPGWVAQQVATDAGQGLFHQPWPPNVQLPLNVTVTRYVLPAPWQMLFARAVPVDVYNPTGRVALYINVNVTMDTASLISQGLMRTDCADVVAVTEWGDPLPTWVEGCNSQTSRVWVMIPVLPPGTWRIWLLHGCPSCAFSTDPRAVFLYYEDMQTPPRGIFIGSAMYDAINKYVVLTPARDSQKGFLVYRLPPVQPSALYVNFRFMITSCGNPGHNIWLGIWDSNYNVTEVDVTDGGYHFSIDEYEQKICFGSSDGVTGYKYAPNTFICSRLFVSQNYWYTYEGYVWFDGQNVIGLVYLDRVLRVYGIVPPKQNMLYGFGYLAFGARTWGAYCMHILGSFYIAHFDPRIEISIRQPTSPPPLVSPRFGLVTYRVYINSTHALLNGTASPGVLAAPFTYTLHSALTSLSVVAGNSTFYSLSVSPSGVAAFRSAASGRYAARADAAYYDASAWSSAFFRLDITPPQTVAIGFDATWTPGDSYRGWVSVWQWGGLWLNVSLVSGHSVAAPGLSVSATSGSYAVGRNSAGVCTLYANGTAVSSAPCPAPSGALTLLVPTNSPGIRVAVRSAWISSGVSQILFDFRFAPPLSSLGALNTNLPPVNMGGPPGQLTPVVLTGAVRVANALWGPFGEICPGRLPDGTLVAFGVRYVWQSPSVQPSCSVPLQTAPPAGVLSTKMPFNATAPLQLYFSSPPFQHPYLVNSVPARFCSSDAAHYVQPYLSSTTKLPKPATLVTDQWACAPVDYVPPGAYVAQSAPGWALIAPVMRVFKINTTFVAYAGSGAAVLARGGAVPALSVRAADGRTWNIYTSGAGAVAYAGALQTPPDVPRTGGAVSAVFGVPRSPTTLISQWWADGARYYISATGLADAPVVYISSFVGSPVAISTELNAPGGHAYYVGIVDNGTYVWAVPLTGPTYFSAYVPAPGYYTVRLYRGEDKVWERNLYLSPDTKLTIGPVDIPVFTPVNPVSLYTPAAPKPPVFVPAMTMEMPPYAVGILMVGVFAAAYVTMREVSLASILTGAVVAVLGVLINAPIYGAAGVFLLAFGLWNKARRQGSA